jgi:hypothetical protein
LAKKLPIAGGLAGATVAVAVAATDPELLVAVRMYEVVAEGVTMTDVPLTAPTPGLTIRPGEPVTAQLSVVDCPAVTSAGDAAKLVMVGLLPATVTVSETAIDPKVLVAVRV